jgi:hypothetical protein
VNLAASSVSEAYPTARFDAVFKRVERKVDVNDEVEYSTVGVRWYGNGAFVPERPSYTRARTDRS